MKHALILVDGRPNETLAQVLDGFGASGELGSGWPRADLDLSHGTTIRCDDWNGLSELLEQRPRKQVTAFYSGPSEDLSEIEGRRISHIGRNYVLQRVPPAAANAPYAHRLLLIERQGTSQAGGSLGRAGQTRTGNLIFCPLSVQVQDEEPNPVGYTASQVNAVMLPPVDDRTTEYFSSDLIAARKVMRNELARGLHDSLKPTVLSLMELIDHALMRPFLTDGGCLQLGDTLDGVTEIVLEMVVTDAVSEYRAGFFEELGRTKPSGLSAVRTALRDDLLSLCPNLQTRVTRRAQSWGPYDLRKRRDGNKYVGSWQAMRRLLASLQPRISVDLQARMFDRILNVSQADGLDGPDHGLTEEAFVRDFARVPWAPHAPSWGDAQPRNTAWQEMVVSMFLGPHADAEVALGFGRAPWESPDFGWEGAIEAGGPPLSVYYPRGDEGLVFRWRLHAPVGALFLGDGWSRIDQGDTMRLGETLRLR